MTYYTISDPQVYAPFEIVPVYQKGFSYYAAVPHGYTAPALHVPVARGNASVRALMRRVDFYIMRQTWVLKDVQAWAEMAATMVSVAISVVASMAVKAIGGAVANKLAGQRGLGAGKALGKFLLDTGKVILQEFAEELVLEPIFGEWFHTAHSMAGQGGGHKRGTLASGSQANAQSAVQSWAGAIGKMAQAVKAEFLAQVKGVAACLRNEGAWADAHVDVGQDVGQLLARGLSIDITSERLFGKAKDAHTVRVATRDWFGREPIQPQDEESIEDIFHRWQDVPAFMTATDVKAALKELKLTGTSALFGTMPRAIALLILKIDGNFRVVNGNYLDDFILISIYNAVVLPQNISLMEGSPNSGTILLINGRCLDCSNRESMFFAKSSARARSICSKWSKISSIFSRACGDQWISLIFSAFPVSRRSLLGFRRGIQIPLGPIVGVLTTRLSGR